MAKTKSQLDKRIKNPDVGQGVGGGRPLSEQKKEARELVRAAAGMDPLEALAYIASGDVVSLGWMTKADVAGKIGQSRVWRMLPAHVRVGAWTELAQYCHPKRKAMEAIGGNGNSVSASVTFVLPSNGREPAPTTDTDSSQESPSAG